MHTKPLDVTKPIQFRNHPEYHVRYLGKLSDNRIVFAYSKPGEPECVGCSAADGKMGQPQWDVINVPPPKQELWVNVYANGETWTHPTRQLADHKSSGLRIARIKIIYTEGQFDE